MPENGVLVGKFLENEVNEQAGNQDLAPFKVWDVREQEYVIFECYGTDGSCISKAWETFFKEFLPQSGYESIEKTDYAVYFDDSRASQGYALVQGRDYVVPEDIKAVAIPVLAHRLICEEDDDRKKSQRIQALLESVAVPTEDWKCRSHR